MTTVHPHPAVAAHERARRRRRTDFLMRLVVHSIAVLLGGWLFMLAIGVVHHDWIRQCPTLGFAPSVLLAVLLRGALAPIPFPKKENPS